MTTALPVTELEPAAAEQGARSATLPGELGEFLVELSVAMHKHAIYPPGHPLLEQADAGVHGTLSALLVGRGALSIGGARRQLIIEGVATDPAHPLLAELAGKLHRHHIGAVKLLRGVERAELTDALSAIGLEPQGDARPLGLQPEVLQTRWTNVKLFPLSYDRLQLLDGELPGAEQGGPAGMRDGHAAQLWVGLARAAIACERGLDHDGDDVSFDPEAVAHAIDEHDREQAYDQVIVGYLLQIARELREEGGAEASGLQRRISQMVGSLRPATLRRLLEMGGDAPQRRRFVLDASQGMTVSAVVELVQAAASAEGQTISHSLVRMLTKLATHASSEQPARRVAADGAFREHVERLVGSWSLDDPNPAAYSAALEQMAQAGAAPRATSGIAAELACEPARVLAMALELDATGARVTGARVTHAITTMLDAGALAAVLDLLDHAPAPMGSIAHDVWTLIAARDPLRALLAEPRLDHALVRRLAVQSGAAAVAPLLDALDLCPEGSRQERLLSYLTLLGPVAARGIEARLDRAAPALLRELLACLGRLELSAPSVGVTTFVTHEDPAVRREAVRLLLSFDATRDAALLAAARDADERVVYGGLLAAQSSCPPEVAAVIRERMAKGDLADLAIRAAAIRAAANQRDDATLEWVMQHALVPGGLLRRPRIAPASPEVLAALSALATHWPHDERAAPVLEMAGKSRSPSIRAAAQRDRSSTATD